MEEKNKKIAWIVHPRNIQDIKKSSKFFSILPNFIINIIIKLIPPYIISTIETKIKIEGIVIAIPMLPKGFKDDKITADKKVIRAIRIAKKKGIKDIGVGGFIPSIIKRVENREEFKDINFYDGIDTLSTIATEQIEQLIEKKSLKKIGILGATTKIGKKISENLSKKYNGDLILLGTNNEHLNELEKKLSNYSVSNIKTGTNLDILKECDLVALTAYIEDESVLQKLKQNSIFFSIIEPVSPFVKKIKQNITVIKGVSIHTPNVFYSNLNSNLEKEYSHACITEAYIMVSSQENNICANENITDKIKKGFIKFNFKPKKINE